MVCDLSKLKIIILVEQIVLVVINMFDIIEYSTAIYVLLCIRPILVIVLDHELGCLGSHRQVVWVNIRIALVCTCDYEIIVEITLLHLLWKLVLFHFLLRFSRSLASNNWFEKLPNNFLAFFISWRLWGWCNSRARGGKHLPRNFLILYVIWLIIFTISSVPFHIITHKSELLYVSRLRLITIWFLFWLLSEITLSRHLLPKLVHFILSFSVILSLLGHRLGLIFRWHHLLIFTWLHVQW